MTATSLDIALIIQLTLFGSAVIGLLIGPRLPSHHLSSETKAVVSASMAVVGTMSALVISLLISNGNTDFKARSKEVSVLASEIVQLDSLLSRYGPEAGTAREELHRYAAMKFEDLFSDRPDRKNVENAATLKVLNDIQDLVIALRANDDRQRWLSAQALQLTVAMSETRAQLVQEDVVSLPRPFLGAVILWLTVLFASFGLFAPRNATTIIAVFACAFAISAAIKLVLDMDTPLAGTLLSNAPAYPYLQRAIEPRHRIDKPLALYRLMAIRTSEDYRCVDRRVTWCDGVWMRRIVGEKSIQLFRARNSVVSCVAKFKQTV